MITGKTYDVLKFCALIAFPATGTLYFTLAAIWGLPAAEQVVGTIVAIDTFLGVVLQISSTKFSKSDARFDGDMIVTETPQGKLFSLELNDDSDLSDKDEILFKKVDKRKTGTTYQRGPA
jgi:hypothetical protein